MFGIIHYVCVMVMIWGFFTYPPICKNAFWMTRSLAVFLMVLPCASIAEGIIGSKTGHSARGM